MVKSGKIREVKVVKEGVSRGRKWSLYRLTFEDGFNCTTFDGIYEPGQEVNLAVEKNIVERNGLKYENYQVVPGKPRKESRVAQDGKFDQVMGILTEISAQLVDLKDEVASLDVPRNK